MGQPLSDQRVVDVRRGDLAEVSQRENVPDAQRFAAPAWNCSEPPDDTSTPWPHRPCEVTMDEPSISRVYDDYLGGGQNFSADRLFSQSVRNVLPDVQMLARSARRFLDRALRYCLLQGIDQVIDIGAGIASEWSSHHVIHTVNPAARLFYVDNEAVAVETLAKATRQDSRIGVLRADVREPEMILEAASASGLIDLTQPVVIVMGLLLHFIPDTDEPAGVLTRYRGGVAPGSHLIMSHDTADGREEDMRRVAELYRQTNRPLVLRSHAELTQLLDGYQLVPPGLTYMPLWQPDLDDPYVGPPEHSCVYAAVGRT